jgi:hypothetical protein
MRMAIHLQIPTTFRIGERTTQLLNVHSVSDVRQIEIHTQTYICLYIYIQTYIYRAQPLGYGFSLFEVKITSANLKSYKSPGSVQIPEDHSSRKRNITV